MNNRTPQFLERAPDEGAYRAAMMTTAPQLFATRPEYTTRSIHLRAATIDEGARSVEAVITTEGRVQVLDLNTFQIVEEVLIARGAELPDQVVLLDSHNRGLVELIRGHVRNLRVDGGNVVGTLFFDHDDRSEVAWQKLRAGSLTDVSAGYALIEAPTIAPGRTRTIGGVVYTAGDTTLRIATKWRLREVSLTPIGADEGAKMRTAPSSPSPYRMRHNMRTDHQLAHRALAAGILHRSGAPVIDEHAPALVRQQQEVIADMGDRYSELTLVEICREALNLEKIQTSYRDSDQDIVHRAVSTAALSDIFTDVVSASVAQGFGGEVDSTRGWISETERHNFVPAPSLALGSSSRLEPVARGDRATYAEIPAVDSGDYRLTRFGKQVVIDAQDIIDDRLDILTGVARALGEAALAVKIDLVYAILLANAALDADSTALFHADHDNLDTGALSSASLQTAISNIAKQREGNRNLNLRGRFLLVPSALKISAALLLRTIQLSSAERINLISESRLDLGVVHPVTGVLHAGSASAFYLVTGPGRGIEVAHMAGSGRAPEIREYPLTRGGRWGLGWDVKFDVAATAIDFRGMHKSSSTS